MRPRPGRSRSETRDDRPDTWLRGEAECLGGEGFGDHGDQVAVGGWGDDVAEHEHARALAGWDLPVVVVGGHGGGVLVEFGIGTPSTASPRSLQMPGQLGHPRMV